MLGCYTIYGKLTGVWDFLASIFNTFSLAFPGVESKIESTHSPCHSRSAVTHIKGEFLFCASPNSLVEERT